MTLGLRVPVIVATLRPQDVFHRCMQSLRDQGPAQADIFLVAQSVQVQEQCDLWTTQCRQVYMPHRNIGLSAAWNKSLRDAFTAGFEIALLMNDDLVLTDVRTLTILRDIFVCQPRQLRYLHDRGFSAIVISKVVWEEVGPFDEGYWPAYVEDNDYHWRCKVAGIPWDEVLIDTEHVGSGTLKADPGFAAANSTSFAMNLERHRIKWGGSPHHEEYRAPWNGGEPRPSTRDLLDPATRDALEQPYAVPV